MATYFTVRWHHPVSTEPVRIFEELDGERRETRKVREYSDGCLVRTDRVAPELDTSLSFEPIPNLSEIEAQADFTVEPLEAAEFAVLLEQAEDAR